MCIFVEAWRGTCQEPGEPFCYKHNHLVCCVCGASATHTCESTAGPLVCGALLCDDCEHELDANGTAGFDFRHCRKTEQKHKPWYVQELENKNALAVEYEKEFVNHCRVHRIQLSDEEPKKKWTNGPKRDTAKLKGRAETIRRLQKQVEVLTPHMTKYVCSECGMHIWSNHPMVTEGKRNYHGECWIRHEADKEAKQLKEIIKERDALIETIMKETK